MAPPNPPCYRLVIGLGNPGAEYERTRHNVGFMLLDRLASIAGSTWSRSKEWKAQLSEYEGALLCKPTSYMNLSGQPVSAVARFYKIPPAEMVVIYDDLALPLGKLRLRPGGSAGGHNGMASIIGQLGTNQVARLRIGIGEAAREGMVSHVLGRFSARELPQLEESLGLAVQALDVAQQRGLEAAMNQFN
ncbi:MAG TPA: aminoacyl-tRNA hydrolase [Chthoniobacteraceae bacterium]|nr:aminoacyl-tRNA hydrolase [Chthoniobacteraceae bacterium]